MTGTCEKQLLWGCWHARRDGGGSDESTQWAVSGRPSAILQPHPPPACWSSGDWLLEALDWRLYPWHLWLPYGPRWGAPYHKGLFFISYWAPSNSCILFIPHTLFSSLLMKSPMPQPSARRRQAVWWTVLFDTDSVASDVTYGLYHEFLLNSLFPHITYHWIICSHHRTSVCISRSVFWHGHGLYLNT